MPKKWKSSKNRKIRAYTQDELFEIAKQSTNQLVNFYEDTDSDWNHVQKTSYCVIKSRKSKEFSGLLYRAEGILPVPPDRVFDIMKPESYFDGSALEWESSIKRTELIDRISDNILIMRNVTHSFLGIISSRDFVDLIALSKIGDSRFTAACSIDYPSYEGCVRGKNYTIGVIASPVPGEPEQCKLTRFLQTDPGGQLPQYLADSAVPSFLSKFYSGIYQKLAQDYGIEEKTVGRSWTLGLL